MKRLTLLSYALPATNYFQLTFWGELGFFELADVSGYLIICGGLFLGTHED